jgi:nuclear transcription factor Y alpha
MVSCFGAGYKENPENPIGSHSISKVSQDSVVLPIEVNY